MLDETSLQLMRTSSNDIRRGNMGTHHPSKEQVGSVGRAEERRTVSRGKVVQSHVPPFRNLDNFGIDAKTQWSLLSGVYARRSEISHTGGKFVICSGLTNSPWTLSVLQEAPSSM